MIPLFLAELISLILKPQLYVPTMFSILIFLTYQVESPSFLIYRRGEHGKWKGYNIDEILGSTFILRFIFIFGKGILTYVLEELFGKDVQETVCRKKASGI